jgi:hypothetical protein
VAGYKLLLKESAAKEVEAVDSKSDRRRIVNKIRGLSINPRPHGSEKLAVMTIDIACARAITASSITSVTYFGR